MRAILIVSLIFHAISLSFCVKGAFLLSDVEAAERTTARRVDLLDLEIDLERRRINALQSAKAPGQILLSSRAFQPTADPAYVVAIKEITPELTGLRLKGQVLNQTSVARENLDVTLSIPAGPRAFERAFEIRRIAAGSSAPFDEYFADVPVSASSSVATIAFGDETLRYSVSN